MQTGLAPARSVGLILIVLGLLAQPVISAPDAAKEGVFKLREVSIFDLPEGSRSYMFLRGQSGEFQNEPFPEVKAYPVFKSGKPIYGVVRFNMKYPDRKSGLAYFFALDESQGTGKGYDRLYLDLNRNLKLNDESVLSPQKNPPEKALLKYKEIQQLAVFDTVSVPFDFGPAGTRAVQLLPRLNISTYSEQTYKEMSFIRTHLYQGVITVGGQEYEAQLGNDYSISGRLDLPNAALILAPRKEPREPISWWGGDRLMAVHRFGGQLYTFAASPVGDELRVSPYRGDLGVFKLGAGGRKLDKLAVEGSLQAADRAVAVGRESGQADRAASASECSIPVGDYVPSYLSIEYSRLRINLSYNYHSDGKPRDRGDRALAYAFKVRKDKPFVLDFSNKPEVMFPTPAKNQRVKRGAELEVKAVLTDPKLDIMIRGLSDSTRKQTKDENGKDLGYQRDLSLDPKVTITRRNGDKVAEGVMPFG